MVSARRVRHLCSRAPKQRSCHRSLAVRLALGWSVLATLWSSAESAAAQTDTTRPAATAQTDTARPAAAQTDTARPAATAETDTTRPAAPAPTNDQDSQWHLVPAVLPAYQPETSFMLGGAAVLAQELPADSPRRESQLLLAGAVSVRKQYSGLLQPDLYLFDNAFHLGGLLSAARFPDRFFGIGNDTRTADKESYTPVYYESELSPKLRVLQGCYVGPSARVHRARIVSKDEEGRLANESITGADGGTSVELGLSTLWDTRDRTLYPQDGGLLRARLASAREHWGSDFDYDNLRIDGRYYVSMPWKRHVLALQQLIDLRRGNPPFYSLGRLGGSEMMRGYYEGKFRDRQYVASQIEYRLPIVWRLGVVAFAAAGTVANRVRDLKAEDLKASGGGGLRVAPIADVPVNIRLDVAYGDELNFYFGIGESF